MVSDFPNKLHLFMLVNFDRFLFFHLEGHDMGRIGFIYSSKKNSSSVVSGSFCPMFFMTER